MRQRRGRSIFGRIGSLGREDGPVASARYWVLLAFLFLCAIGGGSARSDILSLIYLRPAAVLTIAILILIPGRWNGKGLRTPFLMLAALAGAIVIQLIPLPPDLWLSLPGRAGYGEAAVAAGVAQPWRPISLTPDLTLNSLQALLIPLAVLIGLAGIDERQQRSLMPAIIGLACLSAFLGIVQLTGSYESPAFLYRVTHRGSAVGLFANRNHEALLLAMTFPLLRLWTLAPAADRDRRRLRYGAATLVGLFLVAMILVTGSRAGLVLGLVGIVIAALIGRRDHRSRSSDRAGSEGEGRPWVKVRKHAIWAVPLVLAALVVFLGRAVALQRYALLNELDQEGRIANLPVMLDMVKEFFPVGSGFGSFDAVFRVAEPDWALSPTYFNHAHNDPVELVLTGGLPALALLAWFLAWWLLRSLSAFKKAGGRSETNLIARGGSAMILLALLASIVDYPLRTPLHAALFAIACVWLARREDRQEQVPEHG